MDNNNMYNQNNNMYSQDNGNVYGQNNTQGSGYSSYYEAPVQPQVQTPIGQDLEEPVSVGEWMIAMLLMIIPCVNIVLMFVWAFSSSEKKSKSNYFKASLIWAGIGIVLWIVFVILVSAGAIAGMGGL